MAQFERTNLKSKVCAGQWCGGGSVIGLFTFRNTTHGAPDVGRLLRYK